MISLGRVLLLLACAILTGCAPGDQLAQTVNAGSDLDFEMWQSSHIPNLSPTQQGWYRKAMKELQLYVVTEWQGTGSQEQRARLLREIDGKTLREVIVRGYELGNDRLDVLLQDQRVLYRGHADLLPPPRTTPEGAARVRSTMDQIAGQIAELEAEKLANAEVLRALRLTPSPAAQNP